MQVLLVRFRVVFTIITQDIEELMLTIKYKRNVPRDVQLNFQANM